MLVNLGFPKISLVFFWKTLFKGDICQQTDWKSHPKRHIPLDLNWSILRDDDDTPPSRWNWVTFHLTASYMDQPTVEEWKFGSVSFWQSQPVRRFLHIFCQTSFLVEHPPSCGWIYINHIVHRRNPQPTTWHGESHIISGCPKTNSSPLKIGRALKEYSSLIDSQGLAASFREGIRISIGQQWRGPIGYGMPVPRRSALPERQRIDHWVLDVGGRNHILYLGIDNFVGIFGDNFCWKWFSFPQTAHLIDYQLLEFASGTPFWTFDWNWTWWNLTRELLRPTNSCTIFGASKRHVGLGWWLLMVQKSGQPVEFLSFSHNVLLVSYIPGGERRISPHHEQYHLWSLM